LRHSVRVVEAQPLHVSERPGTGPVPHRLVLAHGFTQNANCWGPFESALGAATRILVDMPGHGASQNDDASLPMAAQLLGQVGGTGTYLGYSMGGRIALHLAIQQPELVEALILIGTSAGIVDSAERIDRLNSDCSLAESMSQLSINEFIDQWLTHPLFAHLSDEQSYRDERLANRIDGLASTLVHRGTGAMRPLHDEVGSLTMPVLILVGADDLKFIALGAELKSLIGSNATCLLVPDVGHACHLEAPVATAALVNTWLSTKGKRPPD